MESFAVCVREKEPVLLVGETGWEKTTLIQRYNVNVILSYKIYHYKQIRQIYLVDIDHLNYITLRVPYIEPLSSTFSRKQNIKFLQYVSSMLEKAN